jgi:glutathione S-transferase
MKYMLLIYSDENAWTKDEREQCYADSVQLTHELHANGQLWRITHHTSLYPEHLRLPAEISLARQDFKDMVAVMEKHMQGCEFIVGDTVTVADFVCAYTLDWGNEIGLLDGCPQLFQYMERMYARPNAPLRIAAAISSITA